MKLLRVMHKNIKKRQKIPIGNRKYLSEKERARDICTPLPFFSYAKK